MQVAAGRGNGAMAERGLNQMDGRAVVQGVGSVGVAQPMGANGVGNAARLAARRTITRTRPRSRSFPFRDGKTGSSAPAIPRRAVNSDHSPAVKAMDRVRPFFPKTVRPESPRGRTLRQSSPQASETRNAAA